MDLLERAQPLADLARLLADCAGGGRVALISGEAGAGKSALAGAFTASLSVRAQVFWGACDPLLTPRALGPLHDIARQIGGALRDRLADGRRGDVFDALLEALDGPHQRARPVVVLEDLHWADEATLDMVAFLGRRLALCRALLVLTYRDDQIGPGHQLRAVLAGLPPASIRRLSPTALSADAVAELARRAGRPAALVHEVTGGNPLLVTEVLAAAEPGVPPTVRDLVLSRLAALSPPARDVAGLVSVVPSAAEAALLGARAEAVDECLARGVLTTTGDRVAFRHELLRRAVEESLSPVRRAALHAEVLAALVARPGVDPARIVHHAHHAGDAAAVLHWAPVAARRATAVGAYRQAAAHYSTALPLTGELPAADRAALLEAYSLAAYHGGLTGEALEARREALLLRETTGEIERIGEDLRWVSRLCWWNGRPPAARVAAGQAVEVLESIPAGRQLAAAYSNLSQLHMLASEDDAAIVWGNRALALAGRLGDLDTELHALVNVGSAAHQRGDPAGGRVLAEAHTRAAAAGLHDHAARALVNLAGVAMEWAEFDRADDALDRVLQFTATHDLNGYERHLLGYRATLRLTRGDWAAARADAEVALAGADQPGPCRGTAQVALGRLLSRRGEDGAGALLEVAAERAYEAGELQFVGPVAAALAEYHWLGGDPGGAAAAALRAWDLTVRIGHPWYLGELAFWLWRADALPESTAGLARPYRLVIDGDWRGAAAAWAERGATYARAEALSFGDAPAAAEALREFDRLGARRAARLLRADLRDRGLRVPRGPRPTTAADPTGLTVRQLEVLRLMADGLSNAEIAARLTVSAKTVDHHVSAVLGKLGVPRRGLAAAAAYRRGLL
jgi:DNA-binding CsgD family transcriptional regulator/tetratricopeptide (TPR) repeat protein